MTKTVRFIIASFIGLLIIIGGTMYYRLGTYKDVHLEVVKNIDFHMLYKMHIGAYHKILTVIEQVEDYAQKNNLNCSITFGEYLDNPETTSEDRLRSYGGCIFPTMQVPSDRDFKYKYSHPRDYLKATFEGSPAVGPFTVYPKAKQWLEENNKETKGAVIEVYIPREGGREMTTEYYFPLK